MEIANASFDESTAAAEAMLLYDVRSEIKEKHVCKFFVSEEMLPQTISVLQTFCPN
jgi:glycine dehydrogenase